MSYNTKNYTEQGGGVTHIGGKLVFDNGLIPNVPLSDYEGSDSTAKVRGSLNDLLTKLKNAGLMVGDALALTFASVTDTVAGHADRQDNTGHISSTAVADGVITITLDCKVSQLKDFEAGGRWGKHKWLGIGIRVNGGSDITKVYYNGSALTAADVEEATYCSLSNGYFVRWVAADLVLAGDDTQPSKSFFNLWMDGCAETRYQLKIVEG